MIYDLSYLDTTPGATGAGALFAPPAGFPADDAARFTAWLEQEAGAKVGTIPQHVAIIVMDRLGANLRPPINLGGPYAKALREFLHRQVERERASRSRA